MQNIEQIYKEYFETVKRYLFCLTHDNDIAEEITQETFYRAVKKINTVKGECKISVWLCQIAKNIWYNELKKNKKREEIIKDNFTFETIENQLENIIISKESKLEIYKKIQKLDEKTRNVMYLRITGELSFKEIGTILNKTENWARVTFYRGKEKLKEIENYEKL